jgi:hypothetical protein
VDALAVIDAPHVPSVGLILAMRRENAREDADKLNTIFSRLSKTAYYFKPFSRLNRD